MALLLADALDQVAEGDRLDDLARQLLVVDQVQGQHRENLARRQVAAVLVDQAEAVGVAVERQADQRLVLLDRLGQRSQVMLDGLRVHAAEQGIVRAADLDQVLGRQEVRHQAGARAVHVVDDDGALELGLDLAHVHAAFEIAEVGVPEGFGLNLGRARRRGAVDPAFDALGHVVERRAPVDLDLDAVVRRRIVARGDHHARAAELTRHVAHRRGREALGHQSRVQVVGLEHLRDLAREDVGLEALVVADDHRPGQRRLLARVLDLVLLHVVGDGLGRAPDVLEREVARDETAPAVGAELDRIHYRLPAVMNFIIGCSLPRASRPPAPRRALGSRACRRARPSPTTQRSSRAPSPIAAPSSTTQSASAAPRPMLTPRPRLTAPVKRANGATRAPAPAVTRAPSIPLECAACPGPA